MAATWILSFAVLGSPAVERRMDSPGNGLTRTVEKTEGTPSSSSGLHSILGIGSMVVTGLAVAALVLPFGLSSVSLLRRTITLEARVRRLTTPRVKTKPEGDPESQDLLFQGTK